MTPVRSPNSRYADSASARAHKQVRDSNVHRSLGQTMQSTDWISDIAPSVRCGLADAHSIFGISCSAPRNRLLRQAEQVRPSPLAAGTAHVVCVDPSANKDTIDMRDRNPVGPCTKQ